jgi:hypothetical protein
MVMRAVRISNQHAAKPGSLKPKLPPGAQAKGAPPPELRKSAPPNTVDPQEVLERLAPAPIRAAYARLSPEQQTDLVLAGGPILGQLEQLARDLAVMPLAKRDWSVACMLRDAEPEEAELLKFWALAARGAAAAAPYVGRVAGAVASRLGLLGPKLSRIFGATQRRFGPAQGSLPLNETRSLSARSWGGAKQAGAAVGRHLNANRGGYGLTAGYQAGSMMAAPGDGPGGGAAAAPSHPGLRQRRPPAVPGT